MKKFLGIFSVLFLCSFALFAQTAAAPVVANDTINQVIAIILGVANSIPAVGPYLVVAIKVFSVGTTILTALATMLIALAGAFNFAGFSTMANWISKVLPYVKFASNYNVQKPTA